MSNKRNIRLNFHEGGGIFSVFIIMTDYAAEVLKPEEVERINYNPNTRHIKTNLFNHVFDQDVSLNYFDIKCRYMGNYSHNSLGYIEDGVRFKTMKEIVKKIRFRPSILKSVNDFCSTNINEKTLGIHMRTGDMNVSHPELGLFGTEHYIIKLKKIIEAEDISNIFLATDNKESLIKFQEKFENVVSFGCQLIEDTDTYKEPKVQEKNLKNPILWEEAMIDCLILSKCSQVLCRQSNLINASILFSDDIKKIHRL